jgi:hypothetical protein
VSLSILGRPDPVRRSRASTLDRASARLHPETEERISPDRDLRQLVRLPSGKRLLRVRLGCGEHAIAVLGGRTGREPVHGQQHREVVGVGSADTIVDPGLGHRRVHGDGHGRTRARGSSTVMVKRVTCLPWFA